MVRRLEIMNGWLVTRNSGLPICITHTAAVLSYHQVGNLSVSDLPAPSQETRMGSDTTHPLGMTG